MKRLNLFDIYTYGKRMVELEGVNHDSRVRTFIFSLYHSAEALKAMIDPHSPLSDTGRRAAQRLLDRLKEVNAHDLDKLLLVAEDEVFQFRANRIKSELASLESVLSNDMPGIACYLVEQKGLYRTEDLIAHADWAIPDAILRDVPDKARKDFCEAGKCLAYELPTACGFHLWRAVESVVEFYYERIASKTFKAAGIQQNWGAYIKALGAVNADAGITGFLDHIRQHHRNPQMHPETVLDLNEALALFDVAKSAIQQMTTAVQQHRQRGASAGGIVASVSQGTPR